MSHKLSWIAAAPMTKGLGATLIAVVTVAMSAITPTRADTLIGCIATPPCSDAFFFPNGAPLVSRELGVGGTDESTAEVNGQPATLLVRLFTVTVDVNGA